MDGLFINSKHLPPCPDPERYIPVRTKKGIYWRRKRGSVKKAKLNHAMQQGAVMLKACSAMSRRIRSRLREYFTRLEITGLHQRIWPMLRRQLKETGNAGLRCLKDMEIQQRFPLERLLIACYTVSVKDGMLDVRIPIGVDTIQVHNGIITGYYFQLIMVYGDCSKEHELLVEEDTSEVYSIEAIAGECRMQMVLPEKEWMVLLKLSCMEGKEPAKAARNYGMKVVAVG